jgi:hypothetical protein
LIKDGEMLILLSLIAGAAVLLLAFIAHRSAKEIGLAKVLVEGMILSLAIIAIIVLGASAKLTSEGLVSVLAAIVGYAVGRNAAPADA